MDHAQLPLQPAPCYTPRYRLPVMSIAYMRVFLFSIHTIGFV